MTMNKSSKEVGEGEFKVNKDPDPKDVRPSISQFIGTDEDLMVSGIIANAGAVDEEEWEKTFLDIKNRGNYYDLIRNMYPLHLPEACQIRFDTKTAKYGWFGKENMEIKCDPSRLIYWTPVNHNNHPEIPKMMFNKHGGLMREGMYLCYMPWKMYEARQEMQKEMGRLKYEELDDMKNVDTEIGGHFDPTEGGRRGASRPGDVIMGEGVISHPDDAWQEAGDKG
jgi:hypothetical protein